MDCEIVAKRPRGRPRKEKVVKHKYTVSQRVLESLKIKRAKALLKKQGQWPPVVIEHIQQSEPPPPKTQEQIQEDQTENIRNRYREHFGEFFEYQY